VILQLNLKKCLNSINTWISNLTKGLLPKTLDKEENDTLLILVNAIYFKGNWDQQFEKTLTVNDKFELIDGKKKDVPMMKKKSTFPFDESKEFKILELPYKGKELSMILFLPKVSGLTEFEKMTSLDTLKTFSEKGLDSSLHMTEVMVSLPKFSFSTSYELEKELPKLGLNNPFGSTADFSGITESSQLKISQIIHKAFVEVDETGTKAAAVTAVVMKRALIKKERNPRIQC